MISLDSPDSWSETSLRQECGHSFPDYLLNGRLDWQLTSSGHPNMEKGKMADENHVSSTSSSVGGEEGDKSCTEGAEPLQVLVWYS